MQGSNMKIPSLKASPSDIEIFIKIIGDNTGNIKIIYDQIYTYLKTKSTRKYEIVERNTRFAIALPSLKILSLIEGKGSKIRLSPNGLQLYHALQRSTTEYRNKFSRLIDQIDRAKFKFIEIIENMNTNTISIEEIKSEFNKRGYNVMKNDDKITKWLRYLEFAGIIHKTETGYRLIKNINFDQRDKVSISKSKVVNPYLASSLHTLNLTISIGTYPALFR